MYSAAKRFIRRERARKKVVVLHLGDHDPSGIDMTRDMQQRLVDFGSKAKIIRLALNEPQIEQYQPPPNPVKLTDSRADDYQARFGSESWELDALDPSVLDELLEVNITALLDVAKWDATVAREESHRSQLTNVCSEWERVVAILEA
jgi:hypothetical protein